MPTSKVPPNIVSPHICESALRLFKTAEAGGEVAIEDLLLEHLSRSRIFFSYARGGLQKYGAPEQKLPNSRLPTPEKP